MSVVIHNYEITKGLVRDLGNLNALHDQTAMVAKLPNIPTLLSAMATPEELFLQTSTFEFDYSTYTQTMPTDKAYNERGLVSGERKVTKTHLFKVPSFGLQGHVRPQDVLRRRKAGTSDVLETQEQVILEDIAAMRRAWALLSEKAIAHAITTGTLYVPNNTVASVDFYQEFTGVPAASRPTVNFNLADPTFYPREAGEDARAKINDNLLEGQTIVGYIAFFGLEFFKKRISHPKEEQAMVDRQGIDSQDPLIKRLGNFAQQYRMYRGADDILYIQYDAKIGGGSLIPDNECYILPVGAAGVFTKAFSPAETATYVNTVAQREYMWRFDNEFDGTKLFMESNFGMYLVNPDLIIKGTAA